MRRLLTLGIALLCGTLSHAPAYELSQQEWRHRLLFLIAPEAEDRGLKMQQREIALRRDAFLLDRDTFVFRLLPDQGFLGESALSAEAVRDLREQRSVDAEDRLVILISKDGGINRRAGLHTDLRETILQIDAMPMRRDEKGAMKKAGTPVAPL